MREMKSSSLLDDKYFDLISDEQLCRQIGVTRICFNNLLDFLHGLNIKRRKSFALGLYLWKLKHDQSDDLLSSLFNVPRSTVERYIKLIRQELSLNFVPLYLGELNREKFIENQTLMSRKLFGDNVLITIWDGTYVYIQKSSNYTFQKLSYSSHKHRALTKPMLAVTSNGYIVNVYGPYSSNHSDANILRDLMNTPSFKRFLKKEIYLL